jgi:hypothetical protein
MEDVTMAIVQVLGTAGMVALGIIAGLLLGWVVCLAFMAIVECLSRDFR